MLSVLVRQIRHDCSLTQRQLADAMGVPLQRVKRLERDEVKALTPAEIDALATKLRVRPDWLLSDGQGAVFLTQQEHAQRMAGRALSEFRFGRGELTESPPGVEEPLPAWRTVNGPRSKEEAELLEHWRQCDQRERQMLCEMAQLLAARAKPEGSER